MMDFIVSERHKRNMTFTHVSKEQVQQMLSDAGLSPKTLALNEDNSFTATFKKTPIPVLEGQVMDVDANIVILKPEELARVRQPNQDPELSSVVHFAFTDNPA